MRGWRVWAAGVLLALLCSSCGTSGGLPHDERVIQPPATSGVRGTAAGADNGLTARPTIPNLPSAEVLRRVRKYSRIEPLGDLQEGFGVAPVLLPPGPVETAMLGTPVSLQLQGWWRLEFAAPGRLDFVPTNNALDAVLPRVSLLRPLGWFSDRLVNATAATQPGAVTEYSPDDIDGWIADHDQLNLTGTGKLATGTSWWDVLVLSGTRGECNEGGQCVPILMAGGDVLVAAGSEVLRIYRLDGSQTPVVAIAHATTSNAVETIRLADELVSSAVVGEPKPHPATDAPIAWNVYLAGESGFFEVAAIPGLQVFSRAGGRLWQQPGSVSNERVSLTRALDAHGEPFGSVTEVVDELLATSPGLLVSVDGSAEAFGQRATILTVAGGSSTAILRTGVADGDRLEYAMWVRRAYERVWVVDSPVGPLLYSVGGSSSELVGSRAFELRANLSSFEFPCLATDSCDEFR